MKFTLFLKSFFLIFLVVFLSFSSFATIEVFSDYTTNMKILSNNTILVNKTLTLKNVYTTGIVPGQLEFKIGKGVEKNYGDEVQVSRIKVVDAFGKVLPSQVRNTGDFTAIIVDIYYPLLPGFEYTINLDYQLTYNPTGIFFKNLEIPIQESTIPIQKGTYTVIAPNFYYFTYLSGWGVKENGNAVWKLNENGPEKISFEYSYIPISIGDFQGSYVFWITINLILLSILFFEVRREVKKFKGD